MKLFYSMVCLAGLLLAGCTKNFEEINTNPNQPDRLTNPGVLFTNAIRSSVNANFDNSYTRGSVAGDLIYNDFASNYANWVRASAPSYFLWGQYDQIREFNEVIHLTEPQGMNNHVAVALIMRSWIFQNLTDLYGPIPFREAASAKYDAIYNPKFDKQEDVYAGLLQDLEKAQDLLGSSAESLVGDIIFGGDISRWKKMATGLTLRLLMRQSKKVDPSAAMANILNNSTKYPLFSSHRDQAALQYISDSRNNEMPLYRRSNSDYATSTRVSKTLIDHLKQLNDPRITVYALPTAYSSAGENPADYEYEGAVNGDGPLIDPAAFSAPGILWAPDQFDFNIASPNSAQGIIMTFAEQQFILAEAAEKGFIAGGSAKAEEYYLDGIEDHFNYLSERVAVKESAYMSSKYQVSASAVLPAASYYTQPEVEYAGSQEDKLEKIWKQRWLASYLVGYESWFEWRRTGFPNIVVGSAGPGYIARRCLYPADEMRINELHYNEAVGWLGEDSHTARVWWDQ